MIDLFLILANMAPRIKIVTGKHPREHSLETEHMEFAIPEHQAQFKRLSKLRFGQSQFPDVSALIEILMAGEMADEVEEHLSFCSWHRLLSIREPAIHLLT